MFTGSLRYRGLKSFRTSPWDADEDLPADYARIFQFKDFKCMRRNLLSTKEDELVLENTVSCYCWAVWNQNEWFGYVTKLLGGGR